MTTHARRPKIYDGDGDRLMTEARQDGIDRILLLPDRLPSKYADPKPRIRIMWGQHLLEDLLMGRYRTLVCAVNADDNSHGIIAQLATQLPTSQWDSNTITMRAKQFSSVGGPVKVIKYDLYAVEVLAILRPPDHDHLTLKDLGHAFKMISEMVARRTESLPVASVCFLGARNNRIVDDAGEEPSFEAVLRTMHDAGYRGDVFPCTTMWDLYPTGVYARYPFPQSLERMREGGF
jgi:hypothetical protein